MEATTKSLRWGVGSGMRKGSRWQLGVLVEYMRRRRGWDPGAREWWWGVMGNVEPEGSGWISEAISRIGCEMRLLLLRGGRRRQSGEVDVGGVWCGMQSNGWDSMDCMLVCRTLGARGHSRVRHICTTVGIGWWKIHEW